MLDQDIFLPQNAGGPMFRGPITDLFSHMRNLQRLKECAHYELLYHDCMEAYGYHRGKKECRMILNDMYECAMKIKRARRVFLMQQERLRQFRNGERKEWAETPPLDLF